MKVPFNFTCPYCEQPTTITIPNYYFKEIVINTGESELQKLAFRVKAIRCPNFRCNKLTLLSSLYKIKSAKKGYRVVPGHVILGKNINSWNLLPKSNAKQFPDYVPEAIRQDYQEACLILNDSPKASATLSRRCLQGIVRDFWDIPNNKCGNLLAELNSIKDEIDTDTWDSFKAIRSVGNIGAHMEKDVNQIIEVEPEEAGLLVELIETFIDDWYVSRHKRQARAKRARDLANKKLDQKKAVKKERVLTGQKAVEDDAGDAAT